MNKMAAMLIYGYNTLKIFFPGTSGPISTKHGITHQRLKPIISCSNDNPGLILTYFTARSILQLRLLYWKMMDSLETMVSGGREFGL